MLGVAAEAEFLRLVEVACASATHGAKFSSVAKPLFIRQKIAKFLPALRPLIPSLPNGSTEDIDTKFLNDPVYFAYRSKRRGTPHGSITQTRTGVRQPATLPPFCATAYEVTRCLSLNPANGQFSISPLCDKNRGSGPFPNENNDGIHIRHILLFVCGYWNVSRMECAHNSGGLLRDMLFIPNNQK